MSTLLHADVQRAIPQIHGESLRSPKHPATLIFSPRWAGSGDRVRKWEGFPHPHPGHLSSPIHCPEWFNKVVFWGGKLKREQRVATHPTLQNILAQHLMQTTFRLRNSLYVAEHETGLFFSMQLPFAKGAKVAVFIVAEMDFKIIKHFSACVRMCLQL